MSSGAGVKIPVAVGDWVTMENLIEDGSANADDWHEFVDATLQGGYWPGFIYKNVSVEPSPVEPAVVGSSGSEPTWRTRWEFAGGNPNHGKDGRFSSGPGGAEPTMSPEDRKTRDLIAGQIAAERAKKGLKPLSENSLRGYAIKEHQRRSEMMAKVESPKPAEPAEIVGGTNDSKRAARRAAAFKAVGGNLHLFGNVLNIVDNTWDPTDPTHNSKVSQHLQDLSGLPAHLINDFVKAGGSVWVGNKPITELHPALFSLKGQQPRGWPPGSSYDSVSAVYFPDGKSIVLGNVPGSRFVPVSNSALHEFGHSRDHIAALKDTGPLLSRRSSFDALHARFIKNSGGKMNQYYVQNGTPAGASEAFADMTRGYFKGKIREAVGLGSETRNHIMRNTFAETGTFVNTETADAIIKYFDKIYAEPVKRKAGA